VLELSPGSNLARLRLAETLFATDQVEEAVKEFEHAVEGLEPDTRAAALKETAGRLADRQELRAAARAVTALAESTPLLPANTLNAVAWFLSTSPEEEDRDPEAALMLLERIPNAPGAEAAPLIDTRSAVFAALGRFDEALAILEPELQALEAAQPGHPSLDGLRARVQAYREGRPWFSE